MPPVHRVVAWGKQTNKLVQQELQVRRPHRYTEIQALEQTHQFWNGQLETKRKHQVWCSVRTYTAWQETLSRSPPPCCTVHNASSYQQEAHTIFLSKEKKSYQNLVIREVAKLASVPTEQRWMPIAAILYISPLHFLTFPTMPTGWQHLCVKKHDSSLGM